MNNQRDNRTYKDIVGGAHLIITDEGVYEPRHVLQYKGTMEEHLQKFVDAAPTRLMDLATYNGKPIHVSFVPSGREDMRVTYYVSVELKTLRFNTTYEVCTETNGGNRTITEKWIAPTFRDMNGEGYQNYSLDWQVPSSLQLYISFEMGQSHARGYQAGEGAVRTGMTAFTPQNSYLHCKIRENYIAEHRMPEAAKGWFRLPTGNVYEDGKICFGASYATEVGLVESTKANLELFYSTPWNSDLIRDLRTKSKMMFRFHSEDNQQLPIKCEHDKLHELMESFNSVTMERIPV